MMISQLNSKKLSSTPEIRSASINKAPSDSIKIVDDSSTNSAITRIQIAEASNSAKSKIVNNLSQSYNGTFGVVVDDYSNKYNTLSSLQERLPISTVSIFKQFGHPHNKNFVLEDVSFIKSQNIKLLIAWEPWNPTENNSQSTDYLAEISTGVHDGYIRSFAQSIKSYGHPVVLRFAHEMNGDWYPWGRRPNEYVSAYRYIHGIFTSEGVSNVTWMWSVNETNNPSELRSYYPGDDIVQIIGIDGFNFGTTAATGWRSPEEIFDNTYNFLSSNYNKPIIISETASAELGGNKSEWVASLFKLLPTKYPKIREVVWFNLIKETDWRIDSSENSQQAFLKAL